VSNYKGYTPAQSKAHNNYIAKFARLEVRTTVEQRGAIQAHAAAQGESVNGFINRAIQEAIERDNAARESARGRTDAKEEVGE